MRYLAKEDKPSPMIVERKTYLEARLEMGEAWMICYTCGAKLYSFDGDKDLSMSCPTPGKC